MILLLAALWGTPAWAQTPPVPATDPTVWTGKRVLARTLSAPSGGLPDEDLEPLLRVQQDGTYNPQDVRQDIATLYRIGAFARIEVDVEDGAQPGPDGEPLVGVYVTYRVYPPPRLDRITVSGNRALSRDAILRATGHTKGDPFFPEEAETVAAAIRRSYQTKGWEEARVTVTPQPNEAGLVELQIQVDEGKPQRIAEIRAQRRDAISALQLQVLLWKHHIARNKPYSDADIRAFTEDLKDILLRKGYYEGRVRVTPARNEDGTDLVIFLEPKRRYHIQVKGRGLPPPAKVASTLRLTEGTLLSRYFAREASERLSADLQQQGYLAAQVQVELKEEAEKVEVQVTGDRGPAWRLGATDFQGDPKRSDRFLRGALRQASPRMLGDGQVTRKAVDDALLVLEEYYRSQGHLSAHLRLVEMKLRPLPGRKINPNDDLRTQLAAATYGNLFFGRVVKADLQVAVDPGPQTILESYEVAGASLDEGPLLDPLLHQPLNPSTLDDRCRQIAQQHQESGYLHADARWESMLSEDGTQARVQVTVNPGPQVYLRSVLIQGYSRTRRSLIEKEVAMKPGEILSPGRLAAIRKRLYDLDLFSRVDVDAVGDEDRIKDLVISVEERPNLYLEAGGSAATDQGLQAFGRAGHRNLFGLSHRLTFLGQAGIGWVANGWALDPTALEWRIATRYEAPGIPVPGAQVAADVLFNAQDQERYYRLESSGFATSLRLSLGGRSSTELAYRVQFRSLLDADPALLLQGDPWQELMGLTTGSIATFPSPIRPESGLQLSLLLDFRDDAFNPRKGVAASLEMGMSDGLVRLLYPSLPEESSWLKAEAALSAHVPLGRLGLLLRLRGGSAIVGGDETLPVEERFRLGGGSNLRGFDVDSVGPANHSIPGEIDYPSALEPLIDWAGRNNERWVPTGGDTMAMGSIELKIPFSVLGLPRWDTWQLALFSDVGNVWFLKSGIRTDSAPVDPDFRYSLGFGIRRSSAVGPIQLDVGFNPSPLADRGEDPLFPGFIPVRFHVSLGAL